MSLAAGTDRKFPVDIYTSTAIAIHLIDVARHNKAHVLNISWGSEWKKALNCSTPEHKIKSGFDRLLYESIKIFPGIVTIAAGNEKEQIGKNNRWSRPADFTKEMKDGKGNPCWEALENVIAVGGINSQGFPYGNTSYGDHIEILAPAKDVLVPSYKVNWSKGVSVEINSWSKGKHPRTATTYRRSPNSPHRCPNRLHLHISLDQWI